MRPWAVAVLVIVLAAPFAAGLARAQALPADADRDGVTDDADACPDSAPYDMVDATGCSVCDCDDDATGEPWASRAAYLRCVFTEAHTRRADGRLTRRAVRPVVRAARRSSCGVETDVRCCLMIEGRSEGLCKVMDELRCDAAPLGVAAAEDIGSGSCFPNPCLTQ